MYENLNMPRIRKEIGVYVNEAKICLQHRQAEKETFSIEFTMALSSVSDTKFFNYNF